MLEKIKSVYILWHSYHTILPKTHRYSIGNRTDKLFADLIELVSTAAFLPKEEKLPYLRIAMRKLDAVKIFLMVLWETKSLDNKKFIALSVPLDEVGKMLGGWNNQVIKQNSPAKAEEK